MNLKTNPSTVPVATGPAPAHFAYWRTGPQRPAALGWQRLPMPPSGG
jgi:hypothetical protein